MLQSCSARERGATHDEMLSVLGADGLQKLRRALGGREFKVPPPSALVKGDHQLVLAIGRELAVRMADRFAGERFYVPMNPALLGRDAIYLQLMNEGLTNTEIAARMGVSVRSARRALARCGVRNPRSAAPAPKARPVRIPAAPAPVDQRWRNIQGWSDLCLDGMPGNYEGLRSLMARKEASGTLPEGAVCQLPRKHGGKLYHMSCLPQRAQDDFNRRFGQDTTLALPPPNDRAAQRAADGDQPPVRYPPYSGRREGPLTDR